MPYLGQVATRCNVPYNFSAGMTLSMCRSMHYMRQAVEQLFVELPGFRTDPGVGETGIGANTTVTASIEYPANNFTQLKFSGSVTGTIPDGGRLLSDGCNLSIPLGAQFWVRTFTSCSAGGVYHTGNTTRQLVAQGDLYQYGVGTTDMTMGGIITSTDILNMNGPCAILGVTDRPSVAILGDSRSCGEFDVFSDASGDLGEVARSIGPSFAYVHVGAGGDQAKGWAANSANRAAIAARCSHSINEYGINDLNGGQTDAQIKASFAAIIASLPQTQKKFVTTIIPYSTSTDSWATLANQSVGASDAVRVAQNTWRRAGVPGTIGTFDTAPAVESTTVGKWKVDGTASKYTGDGVHESQFGYQAIASSGAIDVTRIKMSLDTHGRGSQYGGGTVVGCGSIYGGPTLVGSKYGTPPTPPFVPTDLGATLVALYDSSVGVSQSGGIATAWADSITPANNSYAVLGGATPPAYVADAGNGKPAIVFNGSSDAFAAASPTALAGTIRSVFAVFSSIGANAGFAHTFLDLVKAYFTLSTANQVQFNTSVTAVVGPVISGALAYSVIMRATNDVDFYQGASKTNVTSGSGTFSSGQNVLASDPGVIFQSAFGIQFLALCDSALSDANTAKMIAYLQSRYGV